jgi:hypothetical protein
MTGNWQDRAPAMLQSLVGPDGEDIPTSFDRRWLWRVEAFLAVHGTTDEQRALGHDLAQYLHETCQHVWRDYAAEVDIPAHRQCLWCNEVEWAGR